MKFHKTEGQWKIGRCLEKFTFRFGEWCNNKRCTKCFIGKNKQESDDYIFQLKSGTFMFFQQEEGNKCNLLKKKTGTESGPFRDV